tara:strand:+ start:134 stop:319 length:186 start_codon:yes stop_codon:yes gene_type:complete
MTNDSKNPVQLIIAGKAHPADQEEKDVIKYIVDLGHSKELRGRVIFVENYDIVVVIIIIMT